MGATTMTWLYAAHLPQAPKLRFAVQTTIAFAFVDVRRVLAIKSTGEGFGLDCSHAGKPSAKPLIAALLRLDV
jgi:hypothetical protein